MPCIALESEWGVRLVPQNTPYRLLKGEVVKGVDWDCNGYIQEDVEKKLSEEGLRLGDAIAFLTKKLGIQECAPCAARREILNRATKLGWKETIKQIKETL